MAEVNTKEVSPVIAAAYQKLEQARGELMDARMRNQIIAFAGIEAPQRERAPQGERDVYARITTAEIDLLEAPSATLRDMAIKVAIICKDASLSASGLSALAGEAQRHAQLHELVDAG